MGEQTERALCPECGKEMKKTTIQIWQDIGAFEYQFCPKCEYHPALSKSLKLPKLSGVSGKALRGIDKKTGQFRMKITYPEEKKGDIMVRTFPRYIVTKPSEWRSSGRRIYQTKKRVAKVYPELKRGDEVHLIGIIQEGLPLMPIMMHNSKIGVSSIFIDEQIKIKKGIFSSFIIRNPMMVAAEEMMSDLLANL